MTGQPISIHQAGALNRLASLKRENRFIDLRLISSEGHEHWAHKVILAAASPIFATQIGPNYGIQQHDIQIHDHDAGAVGRMLSYIYEQDYSLDLPVGVRRPSGTEIESEVLVHLRVYRIVKRYEMALLQGFGVRETGALSLPAGGTAAS